MSSARHLYIISRPDSVEYMIRDHLKRLVFIFKYTEITCKTPSTAVDKFSVDTLSSNQLITNRCPVDEQQQMRFTDGTILQVIKCTVRGLDGVFSQQPTICQGMFSYLKKLLLYLCHHAVCCKSQRLTSRHPAYWIFRMVFMPA